MYLYLYLVGIGTVMSIMDQNQESLNEIGVLVSKFEPNVVLIKDSILVTMIYKLSDLRFIFNNFIENLDTMTVSMEKNDCLEEILASSRQKRFFIKKFLDSINGTSRDKRQAVMGLVGLTSLLSFGLTSLEVMKVNEKVEDMKERMSVNENSIKVLNSVTSYNSAHINELIRVQSQTNLVLKSLKQQVLTDIGEIN